MTEREFSAQGVRIFYAPSGVMYDDGETNAPGWYIQQMAIVETEGEGACRMVGTSDGIGPYMTFEGAVGQIANEFGRWVAPQPGEDQLVDPGVIATPED